MFKLHLLGHKVLISQSQSIFIAIFFNLQSQIVRKSQLKRVTNPTLNEKKFDAISKECVRVCKTETKMFKHGRCALIQRTQFRI